MTVQLSGFDGKVAVVTGAGRMRSIGHSVALQLAAAGCHVAITGTGRPPERYPDEEKAVGWRDIDSVADEIVRLGRATLPVVSDASDEASVEALADRVMGEFGRVDIVVNNAGSARGADRRPILDLDPRVWRHVIDLNLTGTFLMCRAFGRLLVKGGRGGSIVNISSIAGKRFPPCTGAYAASKVAIHALTACMAQEVGSAGVRVNAICPGYVDTSRLGNVDWEHVVGSIPLGRAGQARDIADAVLFLCSDEGAWVTGQAWNVDGGSAVQH